MTTRTNKDVSGRKRSGGFFKGVLAELKKVNWPTRKETLSNVANVLMVCFLVSVLLGIFDGAFHFAISKLIGIE